MLIKSSEVLQDVRYEIRGQLANHALELENLGQAEPSHTDTVDVVFDRIEACLEQHS